MAKRERFNPGPHVLVGGPKRVVDGLRAYADVGAAWVIVGPVDASNADNASILGEAVLPLLT